MPKYKCLNCNYSGKMFIFEFNDYRYCLASNDIDPEYIKEAPLWVKNRYSGDAKIGKPVGCPRCHVWGEHNFIIIL